MTVQTAELTRLMSNARIYLPGALDDGLKLELFNVLNDFLQQSKFWREDIDYTANSTRTSYELAGTEEGAITELVANVDSNGNSVPATMDILGTLALKTAPSQTQVYTATVAYTVVDPTDANSYPQFPDGLLQKYGEGILAGLLGKMMSQPAKPWTNERMAIFNLRKFAGAVANARAAVRHKNLYGGQTWHFPKFAGGRQR